MYYNETEKRFLGLDFGDKTIGVSVSSPSGKVAIGITTLVRENTESLRPSLRKLKNITREYGITNIVLGYPVHLDGRESPRCIKTMEFKEKLGRYFKSIAVELWDERLSTRAVSRTFEGKRTQYKQHVDEMAAVYILQGFLDKYNLDKEKFNMEQDPKLQEFDEDDATITLYDEDGNEVEMQILAIRKSGDTTYAMVVEEDDEDSEVMHFKLIEDDDNDTIFEMIDEEHEDFNHVFELFKDDYKALGVDITDFEL